MRVYLVFKHRFLDNEMLKAFDSLDKAKAYCKEMEDKLPLEEKPEYDEYGLSEGTEYIVVKMEVE